MKELLWRTKMILDVYRDSLSYSVKEKSVLIKLGLLIFFSFLIIPTIFTFGYSYRTIQIGLNGVLLENEDILPKFGNLKQLFIQGIKIIAITIIYSLPALIISILLSIRFNLVDFSHLLNNFKINLQLDFGIGFIVLLLVIWFITFLFLTTAIPHMINRESMRYSFKLRELITIIKHVTVFEYFKFFISFIILAITFLIVGFLATEAIVNILNIIFSNFHDFTFKGSNGVYLTLFILTIVFSFILLPIFIITESRVSSFIYNEDALVEEDDLII